MFQPAMETQYLFPAERGAVADLGVDPVAPGEHPIVLEAAIVSWLHRASAPLIASPPQAGNTRAVNPRASSGWGRS